LSTNALLDTSRIRRVLVIKLRHHGDVLLARLVPGALKRHLPEAKIGAAALSRLQPLKKRGALREEWRGEALQRAFQDLFAQLPGGETKCSA
jgi:hypothetical protein